MRVPSVVAAQESLTHAEVLFGKLRRDTKVDSHASPRPLKTITARTNLAAAP